MSEFDDFIKDLLKGIEALAKTNLKELAPQGLRDAKAFVRKTKKDIERYTSLLASGKIKRDEFDFLLRQKEALATMEALQEAGVALTKVQRFRDQVIDLIIEKAFKFI